MDKADKPGLLLSTRRPFKSRDLALSREVNRQGQRNRAIVDLTINKHSLDEYTYFSFIKNVYSINI